MFELSLDVLMLYDGLQMDKFLSPYYFYYIDSYWIYKQEDLLNGFLGKLGLVNTIVQKQIILRET